MSKQIADDSRTFPTGENRLSDKQRQAIDLLISGATPSGIAEQLSIDPKTLYNWRQKQAFRKVLRQRRRDVLATSADEIRALISPAIAVLREELSQHYDRARFRAAATILRLSGIRDIMNGSKATGRARGLNSER